jgi:hypothetical protein
VCVCMCVGYVCVTGCCYASSMFSPMDAKLVEDGNLPDMSVVPYGKEVCKIVLVCGGY